MTTQEERMSAAEVSGRWQDERIAKVEQAIIQINHFTEHIEKLDLVTWKADVSADIRWMKYLLGTGAAAGVFQVILTVIKELK